ncbi:MAG TPA: coenzyme F420-0:L-glutamate ligase [Propionibacteriaceae bacterium]|jgi:F420-0:gamma-glutamyl ligase
MLTVWAVAGLGEILEGDDLAVLIGDRFDGDHPHFAGQVLTDGDIVAVTSKIVSKAESRARQATDREEAISEETVRVIATREHRAGVTRIVQNRLGLVMAAAGVDSSNTRPGTILLLPIDPDASAGRIASALRVRFSVQVGVIISDTLGRPWREGQTDVAIGAAGIRVLDDLRGTQDASGRRLDVSVSAVADEIAGAADLVKGKSAGLPVAVVRGLGHLVADLSEPGARSIVRPAEHDMFRLGSDEAFAAGRAEGFVLAEAKKTSLGEAGREYARQ